MPTRNKKAEQLLYLKDKISSPFLILLGWRGLSVKQQTQIRRQFQDVGATFTVAKNTLAKKVSQDQEIEGISLYFRGSTILITSQDNFAKIAKVLQTLIKEYPQIEIKIGVLNGKIITPEDIKRLSLIPPREILIGQIFLSLTSPISSLVQVLQAPMRNLLLVLQEYERIKLIRNTEVKN